MAGELNDPSKPAPRSAKIATRAFLALQGLRDQLRKAQPSIPILSYHRISALQPNHYMTILPDKFERILREVQKHYTFVSLAEIDELLKRGRLDAPVVGLSFDDAYGCNATYAVPIMKALRIPATFFVSCAYVDSDVLHPSDVKRGYTNLRNFTSDELCSMANSGLFEIGSHTVTHIDLSRHWKDETILKELVDSKATLEAILARPVPRFAFPFGQREHCNERAIRLARVAGYERVYSFFGGRNVVKPGGEIGYVLQRIGPVYDDPEFVLACLANFRGRNTRVPLVGRGPELSREFHPSHF